MWKDKNMNITREWAMPDRWTFKIIPIKKLLDRYVGDGRGWIDPFCGTSKLAEYRNDLNPRTSCESHVTALEYCQQLDGEFNGVLFDPPYSGRQVKECYDGLGLDIAMNDTNAFFYTSVRDAITNKIKPGGYAICFGWNSNGFGKTRGYKLIEILLVAHGGNHNDTICTVEQKMNTNLEEYL